MTWIYASYPSLLSPNKVTVDYRRIKTEFQDKAVGGSEQREDFHLSKTQQDLDGLFCPVVETDARDGEWRGARDVKEKKGPEGLLWFFIKVSNLSFIFCCLGSDLCFVTDSLNHESCNCDDFRPWV